MSPDPEQPNNDENPLEQLFKALFGGNMPGGPGGMDMEKLREQLGQMGMSGGAQMPVDMNMFAAMMPKIQNLMSGADTEQIATQRAEAKIPVPDAEPTTEQTSAMADAFRLAELWLDPVTEMGVIAASPRVLTRHDWVKSTLPVWKELAAPVRTGMESAVNSALNEQMPEGAKGMFSSITPMLSSLSSSMFSMQIGEAVGTLSGSVLTTTDLGFPLLNAPVCGLVDANVIHFADEIEVDPTEVRIYLAVRELAHMRLFARAPWLRAHVESLVRDFARGQSFDMSKITDLAGRIDPSNLESLQEELRDNMIVPPTTNEQKRALERLETTLALIEGWVDVVTHAATARLEKREMLRESMRRRRATGGPAERTFASLVGLQLRPRRLRDAAALFANLDETGSAAERDAVWNHPDLLPAAEDLDDPLGYRERREEERSAESEVDAALSQLFAEADEESMTSGDSATPGSSPIESSTPESSMPEPSSPDDSTTDDSNSAHSGDASDEASGSADGAAGDTDGAPGDADGEIGPAGR